MTRSRLILRSLIVILSFVTISAYGKVKVEASQYWLSQPPDAEVIETALWDLSADGDLDFDTDGFILSVSPSGNNILIASIDLSPNLQNTRPGNTLGKEANYIALYTKEYGSFVPIERIYIDNISGYRWNDVVISGDETGIAWSEDETRLLFSAGKTTPPANILSGFSSIFLVDFNKQSVEDLTSGHLEAISLSEGGHSDYLPQWLDNYNISFIRYKLNTEETLITSIVRMDIYTGSQKVLADLSTGCPSSLVSDYTIHGDYVYFSSFGGDIQKNGFLSAELAGTESTPTLLLSFMELLDDYHMGVNHFTSAEVSYDGRWALLTILDRRILMRDFPLADCPENPQSDPSSAISMVTGRPWTPFHNVILFDLYNNTIVDPFINSGLIPTKVVVTAATFAPDGKSLLCIVFGDSDMWTLASFAETSVWQVCLADNPLEAIRVFRRDISEYSSSILLTRISWLDNDLLWIRPTWMEFPFRTSHLLTIPAAFETLND